MSMLIMYSIYFLFFKQKTAYEMRISDWSSDVCSSDLARPRDSLVLAAVGDLHVTDSSEHRYRAMFEEISARADILALCGDLTNFGKTREAEVDRKSTRLNSSH